MKILRAIILLIVSLLLAVSSAKADLEALYDSLPKTQEGEIDYTKVDINLLKYHEFSDIKMIGKSSSVYFQGNDAKKIGLDEDKMTDYLMLRIRNNFANTKIGEEDFDRYTGKQIGSISFRIWIIGDVYPIDCHLKCEFWNFDVFDIGSTPSIIYVSERLGHGTKDSIPDMIKKNIDEMIEQLAIKFHKVRMEL